MFVSGTEWRVEEGGQEGCEESGGGKIGMCWIGLACEGWEAGARGLPASKKSPEWALVAVVGSVRRFGGRLLEAPATDVLQGNFVVLILVSLLLGAAVFAVELDADVHTFHVGLGNTVDVGLALRLRSGGIARVAESQLLAVAGERDGLQERVLLGNVLETRPDALEPLVEDVPVVGPFQLAHLPCIVDLLVSLQHEFMLVIEAHIN